MSTLNAPPSNAEAAVPDMLEQIREIEDEIDVRKDKLSDLWASAREAGLDVKAMKIVLKELRDPDKLAAHLLGEMALHRYRIATKLVEAGIDTHTAQVRAVAAHLRSQGVNVQAGMSAEIADGT